MNKEYINKMNIVENYKLNREIEIYNKKKNENKNESFLEDRDLFLKYSNMNDQIDITNNNSDINEFMIGMPIYNTQIHNNKKGLLMNPYITESDDNNFKSYNITLDSNMYEEIEENKNRIESKSNIIIDNMAYNISFNKEAEEKHVCKIERDIAEYEYDMSLKKELGSNNFVVDLSSPYCLGYIWKMMILLSKNPSLEKFMNLLNIRNRDVIINDMKEHNDIMDSCIEIKLMIPNLGQVINSNFINKIEDIYKIKIGYYKNMNDNTVKMSIKYNIELRIPENYNSKIVYDYMINYRKNKFKFIEMEGVLITIKEDDQNTLIEIPLNGDMILGFVYNKSGENIAELPYNLIIEDKKINYKVNKLTIPKINRNRKFLYSKQYENEFKNVHLGEITYSKLYNIDVICDFNLDIKIENTIKEVNKNINTIDNIKINHKCYYYIKQKDIMKILMNGVINYFNFYKN